MMHEPARAQTTLRLPSALMEQLRRQAQEMGITVNDLIVFILRDALQNSEKE